MKFLISADTDIGIKKSTNQDSLLVRKYNSDAGEIVFAVLCDGMGGLSKGEIASASLLNDFAIWSDTELQNLRFDAQNDEIIKNQWTDIITFAGKRIMKYGRQYGIALGTTVTAMLITSDRYYVLNVGDTRAYEIAEDDINIITKDHTVVAREVELGRLTPIEAENDPRRSVLLQCVGASEKIIPDMFFGNTKPNTSYMLCTDGFRHEITPEEIMQAFLPSLLTSEDIMSQNIRWLIDLNKSRQEKDNITVALIRTY